MEYSNATGKINDVHRSAVGIRNKLNCPETRSGRVQSLSSSQRQSLQPVQPRGLNAMTSGLSRQYMYSKEDPYHMSSMTEIET